MPNISGFNIIVMLRSSSIVQIIHFHNNIGSELPKVNDQHELSVEGFLHKRVKDFLMFSKTGKIRGVGSIQKLEGTCIQGHPHTQEPANF